MLRLKPTPGELTQEPLAEPQFIVRELQNGTSHSFAIMGVLRDGQQTPASSTVTAIPRATGEVTLATLRATQFSGKWRRICPSA